MILIIDRLVRWLALFCGGLILVALMAVTIVDVVYRYVLNAPIFGAHDVSVVLLVLVVAFSIAYGGRTGAHVAVEVFTRLFTPLIDRVASVFVRMIGAGVMVLVTWQLYLAGAVANDLAEGSQLLAIPFQPFYYALCVGIGLYAAVLVMEAVLLAVTGRVPVLLDESRETGNRK
jgi:TRAP-type C4-dicarboxylate transport system permease small subunit